MENLPHSITVTKRQPFISVKPSNFDALKLKNLRHFEGWSVSTSGPNPAAPPQVKSLNCPRCGAAITLRSFTQAVTVVCDHCHSILDAQDPRLAILQTFKAATSEDPPSIPLERAVRSVAHNTRLSDFSAVPLSVEGIPYSWHEYVLFNPYKGFRYLTEYNGHWNDTSILRSLPTVNKYDSPPTVSYLGETYKHFQTAQAATSFVLGEFPWQVRVGETADVSDYVSPPRVLSSERREKKSHGRWANISPAATSGRLFVCQVILPSQLAYTRTSHSPLSDDTKTIWMIFAAFATVILAMMVGFSAFSRNEKCP